MADTKNTLQKELILSKKVGLMDKYNFYEYIAVMLDGGVGVTESLESVHSKITSPYFKLKLRDLITFVSSGDSFSRSMKKVPSVFNPGEISMIEAGETTGELSSTLLKLSDDLKKIYELQKKVKGALTYPIIIMLFLILAIGIVMTFVIPAIKPLFEDAEQQLPMATRALIAVSDFMVNNYGLLILLFASAVIGVMIFFHTSSGRVSLEKMLLKAPLIGKVYKNYILSKVASTLGNLVGSGVPIVKSLQLTGKATNSYVYGKVFDEITDNVRTGNGIVASMEKFDTEKEFFPADYLQMLSVGEKTANLEEISKKLNKQYEKEVDYSLAALTKWIEPIAVGIAGIFITWFALAIFGAILKITDTVG